MRRHKIEVLSAATPIIKSLLLFLLLIANTQAYASDRIINHIDIHAGQRTGLQLIKQDPDSLPPRGPFRDVMSPLSLKHGIQHFAIDIDSVIKGDFAPNTLDVYLSWSSEKSNKVRKDIGSNPVVAEFNKLATQVPAEVKGVNLIASEASQISFSKDKVQTVTYVWLAQEKGEDYARYLSGTKALANRLGVITQAEFDTKNGDYHAYPNQDEASPDFVTFMEWPSSDSITEFFNSKDYKQFGRYLDSGTANFVMLQFKGDSFYSSTEYGFRLVPETL